MSVPSNEERPESLLQRFAGVPTKKEKLVNETRNAKSNLDTIQSSLQVDGVYRATSKDIKETPKEHTYQVITERNRK